ncbi:MAG: DUF177 domain-containing protein [Bdellovibrionales bacterium]|nr:DUF177 domain-containing protein [Bdellovibrionales bacterium]
MTDNNRDLLTPVEIVLSELPEEGRTLHYTTETGELNDVLRDVIGNHSYDIKLTVMPMGNAYSVVGSLRTRMDLVCSKCAMDFAHSVNEKVDEIFVIEEERPRTAKSARVNHSNELDFAGPDCTELSSPVLNMGDYVREIIALSEPIRPLGGPDCETSETCPNLIEAKKGGWAPENFTTEHEDLSPFAALKDFKLNN